MIRPSDVPAGDPRDDSAPAAAPVDPDAGARADARAGTRATPRDGAGAWIGPLILLDLVLLIAAWFLPLMTLKSGCMMWDAVCMSREETSIAGTVRILAEGGEWLLVAVIGGFAMLFPALKLAAAGWVWARVDPADPERGPKRSRAFAWMQALGKWSMIDVFIVALIVVGVKVSLVAEVEVHAGIYVFTAAVALSILVMHWLERRLKPARVTDG